MKIFIIKIPLAQHKLKHHILSYHIRTNTMFNPRGRVVQTPVANRAETECESSPYSFSEPRVCTQERPRRKPLCFQSGCTRNRKVGTNPNRGHSFTPVVRSERNRNRNRMLCQRFSEITSYHIRVQKIFRTEQNHITKHNLCTKFHIRSLFQSSETECQK